jgi:tetratricopeptide (TPR) repeat protein
MNGPRAGAPRAGEDGKPVVAWRCFCATLDQPMNPKVQKHVEFASGYLDLKMFADALREADLALGLAPNDPHALAVKSAILWEENRLSELEPYMAKLAELNPRNPGLWINLAYVRRRTQSLDAAVETLQRAFAANPQDALAHFNMACYRAVQARPQEALILLRNALHLDPKLRDLARAEKDFDAIRDLPEFQQLLTAAATRGPASA